MTKIEMHQKLQPLYKMMMGEWKEGDRGIYDGRDGWIVACDKTLTGDNDIIVFEDTKHIQYICKSDRANFSLLLRYPLPIDPVNPERGLWGMVDWTKFKLDMFNGGKLEIYERRNGLVGELIVPETADPEEALLKALIEQENV